MSTACESDEVQAHCVLQVVKTETLHAPCSSLLCVDIALIRSFPECSPLNRRLCLSFQDRDNSGGIEWKEFVGLLAAFARDNVEGTMSAGECCWHSLLT